MESWAVGRTGEAPEYWAGTDMALTIITRILRTLTKQKSIPRNFLEKLGQSCWEFLFV